MNKKTSELSLRLIKEQLWPKLAKTLIKKKILSFFFIKINRTFTRL